METRKNQQNERIRGGKRYRLDCNPPIRDRDGLQTMGLTPRAVLDKFARIQMIDVWLPTTDGRFLVMPRHTEPDPEQAMLLHKLNLELPPQPPPRIRANASPFPKSLLKM